MKKIKFFALAATVAMVGLTSCSKDNAEQTNAEKFNVTLNFTNPSTRADQAAVTGAPVVTIENGYIVFVNAGNMITQSYKIVSGAPGTGEIANGTGTKSFTNVPGATSRVYLIANIAASVAAPADNASITTYLATEVMKVEEQTDVTKVTVIGSDALVGSATAKTATITPTTQTTRVQIKEIELAPEFTAGTVEGIYINGFYKEMKLNATGTYVPMSSVKADFVGASAMFTGYTGILYDEAGFPAVFTSNVTPTTAGGVWGYNLFASTATPQIIIKLKDVNVGSGVLPQMFATVSTFKKAGSPVPNFEAGKYYTIDKITIPAGGISVDPGVVPVSVNVTVNTVTWAGEAITGEI